MKAKTQTKEAHPVFQTAKGKKALKALKRIEELAAMKPEELPRELFKLWQKTKRFKRTYERLDALVALQTFGPLAKVEYKGVVYELEIEDNFAEKNVVYRPAGVRRKELKVKVNGKVVKE